MRKFLAAGAMALTTLGSLGATASTANAEPHGGWHGGGGGWHGGGGGWHGGGWRGGRGWGYAGAGLAGLAIGAAIAGNGYYGPGYGYGYYGGPGYYDGYEGGNCVGTRRVWDPYYGGYVVRRFYYAC